MIKFNTINYKLKLDLTLQDLDNEYTIILVMYIISVGFTIVFMCT